ncbi:MAG: hypothetical protein QM730_23570 [Anaerolineales bacterium]
MMPRRFKFSPWFVIGNYSIIPLCFLLSAFFLFFGVPAWLRETPVNYGAVVMLAISGIGFAIGGGYYIRIIPRLREEILVTDTGIVQEHADGATTQLRWDEDFTVRNRAFLGRIELTSLDQKRTIMLEQQLDNYQELLHIINAKSFEKQNIRFYQ